MLRTQFKFFIRIFLKDKFFSLLNILGLALGIAISILLLLILQNDLTYDKHNVNYARIYRLGGHLQASGVDFTTSRSARELGQILKDELPEVQSVVRANSWDHVFVRYENKKGEEKAFYEEDVVRTDSNYFQVFTNEFISGNPKKCLTELNTLVLTESKARKYFGDDEPMEKTLQINGTPYRVTGVIKDLPANTHLKFDILLSRLVDREWVMDQGQVKSEAFWNPDVYTYLLVSENYQPRDFAKKFTAIYTKYFKSFGDKVGGKYTPVLEPLARVHFYSTAGQDEPHGNIAYVYAFTGIGAFIILLACINYMNLSTAKSVNRAAEIAMKKTLGSGKTSLMFSFLGESVLLSIMSLLVALVLVFLVLTSSSFNQLIDRNLTLDFLHNPTLLFGSVGITILIGVISGLYPAFYLPRIPTLSALKGTFKNKWSSLILRKTLITTQFAISIFVVVCTLFMKDQIDFVRNKELGFNKDNIVILPIQDSLVQTQIGSIKTEFMRNPRITGATTSYNVLGMGAGGPVMWAEGPQGMQQQAFKMMNIGDDYLKTMGIKIIAGRDFLPGPTADLKSKFIVNEAAARLMGWGADPVGKKVRWFHDKEDGQVIGMVKDFNFESLHSSVEPMLLVKSAEEGGWLHLKVSGDHLPETMAAIRSRWTQLDHTHPYEYFFLDQRFDEQYKADESQYKLLTGLSWICIFISFLGLLGLSAFTAASRTREIGMRKVLGASIPQIVYLLFKDVMYLVIIASVLIIPVAWYTMSGWISNFAYKITINYAVFAIVGVLALIITFITVAFHSLKTARRNPVDSLKYE